MIKNILFAGCSFTWGQSLHYYGGFNDDDHPKDGFYYENRLRPHHYQFNVDNRFATIVADNLSMKPKVRSRNGASNWHLWEFVYQNLDENTKVVIIQTTSLMRCIDRYSFEEQFEKFDELIDFVENKGVIIRFIHFDLEDFIIPPKILDRTIFINGNHSFINLIMKDGTQPYGEYCIWSEFKESNDTHFNIKGHKLIAEHIIEDLKQSLSFEKLFRVRPKKIKNNYLSEDNLESLKEISNNIIEDVNQYEQILIYNHIDDNDGIAFTKNLIEKNDLLFFTEAFKDYNVEKAWVFNYSPNSNTGFHSDDLVNRYVIELKSSSEGEFIFIQNSVEYKITEFNDILLIGDYEHTFNNNSNTENRISLVFDLARPLEYDEIDNLLK